MLEYKNQDEPAEGEAPAPSAGPARYSQDYLSETQAAAPPITFVGFSSDGSHGISFILRSARSGRELKRISASKDNLADERPRSFFQSLARSMYGSSR